MSDYNDNDEPFKLMVDYSPVLDKIHDSLAGTQTIYTQETMKDPLTNQPIKNSEGKPYIYLKQKAIPKEGVTPVLNKDGVEFVMGVLQAVVNRAGAFASMSESAIVYEANDTVTALNDNITLNTGFYQVKNLAAWKSETKVIRNFIYKFGESIKGGQMMDWSSGILGINYSPGESSSMPQRKEGLLERMFSRKGMVDNREQFR